MSDNPMAASYTPRVASQEEVKAASQAQLDGQSAARLAADNAFAPRAEPGSFDVADVEECLRDVIDPELGINVVDLGLLYGVEIGSSNEITLDMTLTSAACPIPSAASLPMNTATQCYPVSPRCSKRMPNRKGISALLSQRLCLNK